MPTDSAFWRDLEGQFRALPDPNNELTAIKCSDEGNWKFIGGSGGAGIDDQFCSLARRAAIAAGAPNRGNAVDWWFNQIAEGKGRFYIREAILKSTVRCVDFATRAFELETAADNGTPPGLRRDRYPFCYWLYSHSHATLTDPKAELEYWKAHAWRGYHVLTEQYQTAWADVSERLASAITGLSYDLAVLQANYVIDRGLRGDEAMRVFRDEASELLEEVTSSWRANCERLAVNCEDDTEELKELAQPFHRVRDDLRRLLHELPAPASASESQTQAESSRTASTRESFVKPILSTKGWSILEWANDARVDFHTAHNYLRGITNPYRSTRKKLADSLGVEVVDLPA